MKMLLRCCVITSFLAALTIPAFAGAEEPENYEKDAQQAENTPPMIPHRIKDTSDGTYCLGCHKTGLNGARETPHPERLSCTGCHAPGVLKTAKPAKKGVQKK